MGWLRWGRPSGPPAASKGVRGGSSGERRNARSAQGSTLRLPAPASIGTIQGSRTPVGQYVAAGRYPRE